MSQVISEFITRLAVHFSKRHESPAAETEWLKSMVDTLRGTQANVLKLAGDILIATHNETRFPLPKEILDACREAAARLEERQPVLPLEQRVHVYSDERERLADDLIMCEMGRQAAREGWILSLYDFCRDHMRLPEGAEIAKCKAAAKGFDEKYRECVTGNNWGLNRVDDDLGDWIRIGNTQIVKLMAAFVKLGSSMLAKREKLAQRVLGE